MKSGEFMDNPIEKFKAWWDEVRLNTLLKQKSTSCVSTINDEGFPESRVVDVKEASDGGFTFCTYLDSSKGNDINRNPKVSLTLWWVHVGYQVRIVGYAEEIPALIASKYWVTRSRDAQMTT